MQKTAKNISLSIAGMMVAVPAGADIASIDYVQRWVQNQSPIPAGSVISGYASGSYGSYLLAGSTVGGPYSGVSISDLASKIPGSKITGFETFSGSTDTNIGGVLVQAFSASGASIKLQHVSDFIKSLYPYQNTLFSPGANTGMTSYMSQWGSYIGGYKSGSGYSPTKILGFTGSGSGIESGSPMWFWASDLANSIQNNIQVWGNTNVRFVSNTLSGSKLWIAGSGSNFGGAFFYDAASLGPYFGGWQPRSSGFPGYFLVGSGSTSGSAMWMWADAVFAGNVNLSQTGAAILGIRSGSLGRVSILGSGGLSEQLFKGTSGSGAPAYILGNSNGTTGVAAYSYNVSNLGTVIGTVKGSQVKIEQTTTAEELQKKTGTIYFPVVQNGTIYGVTLNDFYILMNAQF